MQIEELVRKPTKAQREVLEALTAGAEIIWIPGSRPYLKRPNGMSSNLMRETVTKMSRAGWIALAGSLGRSWYEITDAGRAALSKAQGS